MEVCYMCNSAKTSMEHVPPKCLFPTQSDSDGKDYRVNLISVPSCDLHNSSKSKEDEYFLICLSMNMFGGKASHTHQTTKLLRILEKKPHLLKSMFPAFRTGESIEKAVPIFDIDGLRFVRQLQHIGYGIYFHKYGKHWESDLIVVPISGILSVDPSLNAKYRSTAEKVLPIFSRIEKTGENKEVFSYQFTEGESGPLVMLTFYENIQILLCPSES